jgi:hypothetical protein
MVDVAEGDGWRRDHAAGGKRSIIASIIEMGRL